MISIYEIKPKFQKLLKPVTHMLYKNGITPNQVTIFTCLLSVVIGVIFYLNPHALWMYVILPLIMFIRMALNAIDGVLAKDYQLQSYLGKYLNELTDVISDAALFLPFILVVKDAPLIVIIFIILSIVSEMAGIIGESISGKRQYQGPMGKSDRAFLIGLISFILIFTDVIISYLPYLFAFASILIIVNIINRIRHGIKEVN